MSPPTTGMYVVPYCCSYTRVLTHYPYVVLAVVAVVAAACLVVTITIGTLPDFTDPRLVS